MKSCEWIKGKHQDLEKFSTKSKAVDESRIKKIFLEDSKYNKDVIVTAFF